MVERDFRIRFERCPFCGASDCCQLIGKVHRIPYFGETIESIITCEQCGFRHADVMHTEEREPRRYEFIIDSPEDLKARVVRSSTGVVEIPELGVFIRPGPKSEGFISNVEGVLKRVEDAIGVAIGGASPVARKAGEEKLKILERMKSGESRGTLVIWDPRGLSAIAHPKAKSRPLGRKELNEI